MKQYKRLSKPQTMALALGLMATGGAVGIMNASDFALAETLDSSTLSQSENKSSTRFFRGEHSTNPLSDNLVEKISDSIQITFPGAILQHTDFETKEATSSYEAFIITTDGVMMEIKLDKDLEIMSVEEIRNHRKNSSLLEVGDEAETDDNDEDD